MKKILLWLLACGLGVLPAMPQDGKARVVLSSMNSVILGVEKDYAIYLPAGYDTSDRHYPVLYLLHGAWGDYTSWIESGSVESIANRVIGEGMALPMIIVMPDARGQGDDKAGRNMGYFNLPGWAYEDYFFGEFIPYIDDAYRTRTQKGSRAIAGLSMGGGGAVIYAQRHPEIFGSACALSALVGEIGSSAAASIDPLFREKAVETSPVEFMRGASEEQLEGLRTVRWYIDCGDDDYLYKGNVDLYVEMRQKKVPLQYRMRDGAHTWEYWQSALPTVLQFVSIGFAME